MAVAMVPTGRTEWEDEIVPALRKRLQDESLVISKRMSGQSLSREAWQNHAGGFSISNQRQQQQPRSTPSPTPFVVSAGANISSSSGGGGVYSKSNIPRPSLQMSVTNLSANSYSQTNGGDHNSNSNHSTPNTPHRHPRYPSSNEEGSQSSQQQSSRQEHPGRARARTISTPEPWDREYNPTQNNKSLYSSTNTNSPLPKSRIPRPNPPSPNPNNILNLSQPNADYFPPTSSDHSSPSYPNFQSSNHGTPTYDSSNLAHGWPAPAERESLIDPVYANTTVPRSQAHEYYPPEEYQQEQEFDVDSRPSLEAETSYEHWYRGDISRSGGVGELKVGRKKEMMDIAQFGHFGLGSDAKERDRERQIQLHMQNQIQMAMPTPPASAHNSVYIEDEGINKAVTEWVIDEMPLTDGEWSGAEVNGVGSIVNGRKRRHQPKDHIHHVKDQIEPPSPPGSESTHSHSQSHYTTAAANTPTSIAGNSAARITPSGNGRQTLQPGSAARRPSPSGGQRITQRSATAPLGTLSSSSAANSNANPSGASSMGRTTKVSGAKSNGTGHSPSGSASSMTQKRARTTSASAATHKKQKQQQLNKKTSEGRLGVPAATAFGPDGRPLSSLVDAIPSWSVPIAKDGNWDEVVLPVVARRMGLEGYEEVDGATASNTTNANDKPPIPEPAPGTFGYDHSKYKPPQTYFREVEEFGGRAPIMPAPINTSNTSSPTPSPGPMAGFARGGGMDPPLSPAPFSRYMNEQKMQRQQEDEMEKGRQVQREKEKERAAEAERERQRRRIERLQEEEEKKKAGCCGGCVVM